MGIRNIHYKLGDGTEGWPEHAPYDRILITAACPRVPARVMEQLVDGGICVAPVGPAEEQELITYTKRGGKLETIVGTPCAFVKLIGADGYKDAVDPQHDSGQGQ